MPKRDPIGSGERTLAQASRLLLGLAIFDLPRQSSCAKPPTAPARSAVLATPPCNRRLSWRGAVGTRGYACAVLEKWQRNAIIEAVEQGGLEPRDCTFDFDDSESLILHQQSGSTFLLEGTAGNYNSTLAVGEGQPQPLQHYTWPTVENRIQRWAEEVKRDVDTPDLWAELQRERGILTSPPDEEVKNTPFTPEEQAKIAQGFREIKDYVRTTYQLTADQYATIDKRLNGLEDAARRGVRRIDWRNQLLGVFLGLVIDAVLPQEPFQQILIIVLRGLASLFGADGVPELPGAPDEIA